MKKNTVIPGSQITTTTTTATTSSTTVVIKTFTAVSEVTNTVNESYKVHLLSCLFQFNNSILTLSHLTFANHISIYLVDLT